MFGEMSFWGDNRMAQIVNVTSGNSTLQGNGENVLISSPGADRFVIPVSSYPSSSPSPNESEQNGTLDVIVNFSLMEGDDIELSGLTSATPNGAPPTGNQPGSHSLYIEFGCHPQSNPLMQELWPSYCDAFRTVTLVVKPEGHSEEDGIPVAILTQTHALGPSYDIL